MLNIPGWMSDPDATLVVDSLIVDADAIRRKERESPLPLVHAYVNITLLP